MFKYINNWFLTLSEFRIATEHNPPYETIQKDFESREIAELTGKNHQHVLRDIDKLNENYEKMGLSKVGQSYFTNEQGREFRQYELTRIQTFDLMTGYKVMGLAEITAGVYIGGILPM